MFNILVDRPKCNSMYSFMTTIFIMEFGWNKMKYVGVFKILNSEILKSARDDPKLTSKDAT